MRAPSPETKLKLLKEIAEEHELDWDPASTETDLFKSHEDLLVSTSLFVFSLLSLLFLHITGLVRTCHMLSLCLHQTEYVVFRH